MYLLNADKAIAGFRNAKGCEEGTLCLDESVDEEKFRIFLRIMKAKDPADILDISVEEIISLYEYVGDFSKYFREKTSLAERYAERLKDKRTVLLGRRIL